MVRAARPEDAVGMAEIERRVSPGPWSLSQFISACRSDILRVLICSCEDSDLAGFAVFSAVLEEATLMNIAVHPQKQGLGLGRALLESVLENLSGENCDRLLLEVRASNIPAITLYRKQGFVEDGLRKNYYPGPMGREDAVLMSLKLGVQP